MKWKICFIESLLLDGLNRENKTFRLSSQPVMKIPGALRNYLFLPLCSGLLLWIAWPPLPFTLLVFVGFVPIFINQEFISNGTRSKLAIRLWLTDFISLLFWNVFTTWWVAATYFGTHDLGSLVGGIFSNIANAALMTLPFIVFRFTKKHLGERIGFISLVCYWMAFEYLHLRWELTWPWLTLGNVFALNHTWVQWYEYTGVFGGTLWVLLCNILIYLQLKPLIFKSYHNQVKKDTFKKYLPIFLIIILITSPILYSKQIYNSTTDIGQPLNVTVVQPNLNPYTEKFTLPYKVQLEKMLGLAKTKLSDSTDYLVFPETAIPDAIWLDRNPIRSKPIRMIKEVTDSFPDLTTIIGINAYYEYPSEKESTVTARKLENPKTKNIIYFDAFNTSIQIDTSNNLPFYHKSKLVPGVERMPYPGVMKFLEKLVMNLGGISGTLGTQESREPLCSRDSVCVATAICYESVFGEYVTRYVNNGANVIFIITNDGWWGNTDGHRQHYLYAKLRAIETRKSIARSANTGTSCFINQRGDVSDKTEWEKDAVLNKTIYENDIKTYYTLHGDYIARIGLYIAAALFLFTLYSKAKRK
ncbi:MAG: apolipoprotein N-acyltransferase [Chitinophagales bacterium]